MKKYFTALLVVFMFVFIGVHEAHAYFLCTDPGSSSSCCYVLAHDNSRVYGTISDGPGGYYCNVAIANPGSGLPHIISVKPTAAGQSTTAQVNSNSGTMMQPTAAAAPKSVQPAVLQNTAPASPYMGSVGAFGHQIILDFEQLFSSIKSLF